MKQVYDAKSRLWNVFNLAQRKYVYVRIPKTGSQSLNTALFNVSPACDRLRKNDDYAGWYQAPDKQWWDHLSAEFCISVMSTEIWNEIISFSVVRNPYARLYSLWNYNSKLKRKNDFKSWVMSGCQYPGWYSEKNSLKHSYVLPASPVTCQKNWLLDRTGKNQVNFTFRLEEIENTNILTLLKEIVDDQRFCLPVVKFNQTTKSRNEYKDYYDAKMIDKVKELCAADLLAFQYDFNGILNGSENFILLRDK